MTDERRVLALVEQMLEMPAEERESFLVRECGENSALRVAAEALLATAQEESSFLTPPPAREQVSELLQPTPAAIEGRRLGRYTLVRRVARGGMATVYEATQQNPTRAVALKLLELDLVDDHLRQRFEVEAEILARLRHPGIAEVYEAGVAPLEGDPTAPPRPYIAMEYLPDARPITTYAREKRLGREERLRLFQEVCRAVHHGHQRGVVHRDLKPANLLVDADARVKVIDFGVARVTHGELSQPERTRAGQVLGTPAYMSPEQFTGESLDLDLRTDVYSLGVVLYELLCDRLPYELESRSIQQVARTVVEVPPTRPSLLVRELAGDLEAILTKALEKDRERRYGTAAELSEDLERHLAHEPIEARSPTAAYRLQRFVQRNRLLAIAAALLVLVLITATAISLYFAFDAVEQRKQADTARNGERSERERAQGLYHDSLALHLEFLGKYVERIGQLAGASRLTADMMASIAANLEKLRAKSEDDGDALLILARASLELGRQRARSQQSHVGEYEEGRRDYDRALELVRSVREREPTRRDAIHLEGSVHQALGDLAVAEARFDDARVHYEQRLSLEEGLPPDARDPGQLGALAAAYDRMGGIAGMSGEHETALDCFLRVVDLTEQAMQRSPGDGTRREWAAAHGRVGAAMLELGRLEESVEWYTTQLDTLEELVEQHPEKADYAAQWVIATELCCRARVGLGDLDEAEGELLRARERLEALLAADTDDARLPVIEIAVTYQLGRCAAARAEAVSDTTEQRLHWEDAKDWFLTCEELVLERERSGTSQPAQSGYLETVRRELARCDEHL